MILSCIFWQQEHFLSNSVLAWFCVISYSMSQSLPCLSAETEMAATANSSDSCHAAELDASCLLTDNYISSRFMETWWLPHWLLVHLQTDTLITCYCDMAHHNLLCGCDCGLFSDAQTLIHAFVCSHLDYCNSLFAGLPRKSINRLKLLQNATAKVLTSPWKYEHGSTILASSHRLVSGFWNWIEITEKPCPLN